MLNRLKSSNPARLHLVLMLVLTFSTGVIDAVGYLGLDRVFTGNMTGNVVILGMALVGANQLPVLGPSIALAGFMLGAVIAGRILKPEAAGWSRRTTALLTAVGVAMTAVAAALFAHPARRRPHHPAHHGGTGHRNGNPGSHCTASQHQGRDDGGGDLDSHRTGRRFTAGRRNWSSLGKTPWRRRAHLVRRSCWCRLAPRAPGLGNPTDVDTHVGGGHSGRSRPGTDARGGNARSC